MDITEASSISRLVNDKCWQKYITPYLENRRVTLIRDFKIKKDERDEIAGSLKELDKFTDYIEQQQKDYKELKEKETNG